MASALSSRGVGRDRVEGVFFAYACIHARATRNHRNNFKLPPSAMHPRRFSDSILRRSGVGLLSKRGATHTSAKMAVPGSGDLKSPEVKAAGSLHHFFTYLAVRIVLNQLEAYNPEAYTELREFVDRVPLKDGDRFLAELMREGSHHKGLALRILEVRSAYAHEDFEWENLRQVSWKMMDDSNKQLMRDFLIETSKWSDKV